MRKGPRRMFVSFLSLAVVFLLGDKLHSRPCRPTLIPNGFTNGCGTCHINPRGGGFRNSFGKSVEGVVTVGSCNPFWSPAIAALDSDGDGIPNGVELQDPQGTWTPGQPPPGDPKLVTNPGLPNVQFIRADSNGDGKVNIMDAVFTLESIFRGGTLACAAAADANGDARLNIVDPIFTFQKLVLGGVDPPAPFPNCDLSSKGLPCQSYGSCGQ